MAKKTTGFSKELKKKIKSNHKKAVMARKTFTVTHKSEIIFNPNFVGAIKILIAEQCKAVRKIFNIINNSCGNEPNEKVIQSKFGFDSTEARNTIRIAKGIWDCQKELIEEQYIPDTLAIIKSFKKNLKNLKAKLIKAKNNKTKTKISARLKRAYSGLKSHKSRLFSLQKQLSTGKFTVCFGSKKLMRQFNNSLAISRTESNFREVRDAAALEYQNKKEEWQLKRDSELFYEGHANQFAGNQKIKLVPNCDNTFTLKVAVPSRLKKQIGSSSLDIMNFNFGGIRRIEDLCTALKPIYISSGKTRANGTQGTRKAVEYPVTHRLKLVKVASIIGVQLITTIKLNKAPIVTSRLNGAIGVDFNQNCLDWTRIDYYGNYLESGTIATVTQDKRTTQTYDILSKAISQLIELALKYKVPLVFEDLAFKNRNLKTKSKKFARMASNLPFAKVRELIEQKAFRKGVEVKFVNPAFSSIIGLYKYMVNYGLNSGTAGGMVIARRGLGFKEKISLKWFSVEAPLEDGVSLYSWTAWGKLAKQRKTIGKHSRHKFYGYGWLRGANCFNQDGFATPRVGDDSS